MGLYYSYSCASLYRLSLMYSSLTHPGTCMILVYMISVVFVECYLLADSLNISSVAEYFLFCC